MAKSKSKNDIQEKDGGFYFPKLDIHVAAKSQAEAKKHIKEAYGIDLDKETKAAKK